MTAPDYWNTNVHFQPVVLRAVPPGCRTALDVGCGDGMLACKLAARCAEVTGIDRDQRMVTLAGERAAAANLAGRVTFIHADFLKYPADGLRDPAGGLRDPAGGLRDGGFDFVCANTSLHHMDFAAALTAMARLLRPGGRLAVIGLARSRSATEWLGEVQRIPVWMFYRATRHKSGPGAPVMDPVMTWAEVHAAARTVLPGVRYRRHQMPRYSLLWRKLA
jgi:ubiquinone/menaquinone biosynthesis C-methylase UbiE